ncbi:GNAT family N-acetyltransferase [Microvirga antarctica]|uniref:GNAT family N-acetyltransferase n=1 Tax=Microvirga antarctica TaxID=2819233 RepID=UPI001B30175F|nr:GNAT family N-acetyltransferase [Microvirga antarctica]
MTPSITLLRPSLDWLPAYEDALVAGWSPNTDQDVSRDQLLQLRRNPRRFLDDLYHSPTLRLPDGREVRRLPAHDFWISDGDFCGRIGFRYQPGTEDLPPSAMGHVGYTIVPWKQRRGYATQALRLILPVARAEGFRRVLLTCDDDNEASQKVILANGGVADGQVPHPGRPGHVKLAFWVPTIPV